MNDTETKLRLSPLYTSKKLALTKAILVKRLGPDKDGAFRAYGRIDGKDKQNV